MLRRRFFFAHAALLVLMLIPAKLLKADRLTDGAFPPLLLLVPDVLFVLFAELAAAGVVGLAGRAGRWVMALWGLLLVPLGLFATTEHRFFLSSGSFLDWTVFFHGLQNAGQITGVVSAEITPFWWAMLGLSVVVGLASAVLGFLAAPPAGLAGARGAAAALGACLMLVLGAWWGGPAQADPRLASLQPSLFLALGWGAAQDLRMSLKSGGGDLDLDRELPDAVELALPEGKTPANVVMIVLESVRADATTPYNPALDTSPFLAKLASEGLKVEHAYTTLPHTTKSLVPIFCGVAPDIRQALSETVPGALPTRCLPEMLRPLGYKTAFFQPATGRFEQRSVLVANAGFEKFVGLEQLKKEGFESPNYLGVEERAMTAPIMEWVDAQSGPFMLGVLTLITHHDYKVPSTFQQKDYGVFERLNNYYNTVRYTDQWLQELFAEFDRRGQLQNTLFVFMGDHGEGHGEHGRKGHDEILYQEGIRVPLIFWGPGVIGTPGTVAGNRQNIDLAPSVVDLLGLTVTRGKFTGRSIREDVSDRVLHVSCWYEDRCLGRLDGDQKYIYYYGRHPQELFDLAADPMEKTNLGVNLPTAQTDAWIAEMEAWKKDQQSLYAAHKKKAGGGFVLFEKPEVEHPLEASFKENIKVIGYDLEGDLSPGEAVKLSVYFEVKKNIGWHWKFKLGVVDGEGTPFSPQAKSSEAEHPLYTWVPGQFMKVDFVFTFPRKATGGSGSLTLKIAGSGNKLMAVSGPDSNDDHVEIPIEIED